MKKRRIRQSVKTEKTAPELPKCSRDWLTKEEVSALVEAARKTGDFPARDSAMILIGYRHGFRVSELVDLRWDDIDLKERTLFARRLKGSRSFTHDLQEDEVKALKRLKPGRDPFVFMSYRDDKMSPRTFHHIIARAGQAAGLPFRVHPHMLRHGCGHGLAGRQKPTRDIQDWLGHVDIRHTEHYTQQSAERFKKAGMWSEPKS